MLRSQQFWGQTAMDKVKYAYMMNAPVRTNEAPCNKDGVWLQKFVFNENPFIL